MTETQNNNEPRTTDYEELIGYARHQADIRYDQLVVDLTDALESAQQERDAAQTQLERVRITLDLADVGVREKISRLDHIIYAEGPKS